MVKFIGCVLLFMVVTASMNRSEMVLPLAFGTFVLFYVFPGIAAKAWAYFARKRKAKDAERDDIARANAAEFEHRTEMRRAREILEMQSQVRLNELSTLLEAQAGTDEKKLRQLAEARAEFVQRQQSDVATLLARLEAMKAESP